jgi:DNA-directed RNA polymerase subunit RPC12/RpoP
MCFSSYLKYLFLSIIVGALIIFSIFSENLFYFLPIMIFAIVQSRIKCPKCGSAILKDRNGWYLFTMRTTCRHCGQDTLLCEVESDAVTKRRLEERG